MTIAIEEQDSAALPRSRRVLPGFGLSLGITLLYVGIMILLPLAAIVLKAGGLGLKEIWAILTSERALASFRITILAALVATGINAIYGLLMAWVLVRYNFPGRRLLDAVMDLPFALPTAVAGIALTALYAKTGWIGSLAEPLDWKIAYTPIGIALAMAFVSAPFVTRTVQPVLEDLDKEIEEAANSLGATRWQTFIKVIFPAIFPAYLAGCSLAFARSLGEFGAVIFIAGNMPLKTEITALLIFIRLEEYEYPAASVLAGALLIAAFLMLLTTNAIQAWQLKYVDRDQ